MWPKCITFFFTSWYCVLQGGNRKVEQSEWQWHLSPGKEWPCMWYPGEEHSAAARGEEISRLQMVTCFADRRAEQNHNIPWKRRGTNNGQLEKSRRSYRFLSLSLECPLPPISVGWWIKDKITRGCILILIVIHFSVVIQCYKKKYLKNKF